MLLGKYCHNIFCILRNDFHFHDNPVLCRVAPEQILVANVEACLNTDRLFYDVIQTVCSNLQHLQTTCCKIWFVQFCSSAVLAD